MDLCSGASPAPKEREEGGRGRSYRHSQQSQMLEERHICIGRRRWRKEDLHGGSRGEERCSGPINEEEGEDVKSTSKGDESKKGTLAEDEKEPKKEMKWRRSKTTLEERRTTKAPLSAAPHLPSTSPHPINPPSGFNHLSGDLLVPSGQNPY